MRSVLAISVICFLSIFPLNVQAKTRDLAVGIASNHIDITVGFDGSSIELFGDRRSNKSEVAIVVEGPREDVTIWQKSRVMGTWVNRYYAKFKDIPTYYHYAISSDKIDDTLSRVMLENGIGHDGLFHRINGGNVKQYKNIEVFQEAFLRKNFDLGVFFKHSADVEFLNENFFRVSFNIPPSAPTGEYKIHSFLIKDGKVMEHALDLLKVEQVGLNAFIYKSAHKNSLMYALVCIFFALFSGWLVSALRVKP